MAGKLSAEAIQDTVGAIKKAVEQGATPEQVAEATGQSVKGINKILEGGKGFEKTAKGVLEFAGGTINALQNKLNTAVGRETTPPPVPSAFTTEVTGPLKQGAGKDFTMMPRLGEPGGALTVPSKNRSLARAAEILENTTVDPVTGAPMSSETGLVPYSPLMDQTTSNATLAELSKKAKRPEGGIGIQEVIPDIKTRRGEESRIEAERAADLGLDIKGLPSEESVKKAGKITGAAAGGAAAYGGFKFLDFELLKPEQQETLGAMNATDTKSTEDIKQNVVNAQNQNAITEDKKEVIDQMVAKVEEAQELLTPQAAARKKFDEDQARLELFQAINVIANGLASAIGSAALLNRGSPYAVDFSKGPQVNWDAQFNRLQKQFDTQMNAITEKYKLEERRKEKEELRQYRQATLDLKNKELLAKLGETQKQELAKLSDKQQTQYLNNLKNFALLREAIEKNNKGDIDQYATLLGAEPATIAEFSRGKWAQIKAFFNKEPSVEEILKGLKPQKPVAPAVPAAPKEAERLRYEELLKKERGE